MNRIKRRIVRQRRRERGHDAWDATHLKYRRINSMNQSQTAGSSQEDCDAMGRSLVHIVAASGDCAAMQRLFSIHHGQVEVVDRRNGATALIWAAVCGHPEMIELLLRAGANANAIDHNGKTALYYVLEAFAGVLKEREEDLLVKAQYRNLCLQLLRVACQG